MKSITTVHIDMDGVIVDLASAIEQIFGEPSTMDHYNIWEWFGIDKNKFWKIINHWQGFWYSLQKYDNADDLITAIKEFNYGNKVDFRLTTSPYSAPRAIADRYNWINSHYPYFSHKYHITEHKADLGRPGSLLIDDCEKNCEEFELAGGQAILYPQPWNGLNRIKRAQEKVNYVVEELEKVTSAVSHHPLS